MRRPDARRVRLAAVALALGRLRFAVSAYADEPSAAIAERGEVSSEPIPTLPTTSMSCRRTPFRRWSSKTRTATKIAGYKAGLTSLATQQRFGVDQPVIGVLPESGRLSTGATLAMTPGLKIEVEIGFLVGDGDQPAAMLPVIELPRLDYADMKARDAGRHRCYERVGLSTSSQAKRRRARSGHTRVSGIARQGRQGTVLRVRRPMRSAIRFVRTNGR